MPTSAPTQVPTVVGQTYTPTSAPTPIGHTYVPSSAPTRAPSRTPSTSPTSSPTISSPTIPVPSGATTTTPSSMPSREPSAAPSASIAPSLRPTPTPHQAQAIGNEPTPATVGAVCTGGSANELCGECDSGTFRDDKGICVMCPSSAVSYKVLGYVGAVFLAISLCSFILVACVQTIFRRPIWSGLVRSFRFAGWIIAIFAMQAQIGRTASSLQPRELQSWFVFIFMKLYD